MCKVNMLGYPINVDYGAHVKQRLRSRFDDMDIDRRGVQRRSGCGPPDERSENRRGCYSDRRRFRYYFCRECRH